jgi:hypothetical protein
MNSSSAGESSIFVSACIVVFTFPRAASAQRGEGYARAPG